jgi:L-alanine-DL-glutamate epimerase-like enolase superfamily enzyme
MALGGAFRCLELARRAVLAGGRAIVTHLHDGPIAHAAACHLSLALPGPVGAAGLDRHAGSSAWPEVELPLSANAVTRSDRAGLGLPLVEAR